MQLPRSEAFYVGAIVVFCLIVIVISVVRLFSGGPEERPAYESAAPAALAPTPSQQIIDINRVDLPPIQDQDFATLRGYTLELAGSLLTSTADLRRLAVSASIASDVRSPVSDLRASVAQLTPSPVENVTVERPQLVIINRTTDQQTPVGSDSTDIGKADDDASVTDSEADPDSIQPTEPPAPVETPKAAPPVDPAQLRRALETSTSVTREWAPTAQQAGIQQSVSATFRFAWRKIDGRWRIISADVTVAGS